MGASWILCAAVAQFAVAAVAQPVSTRLVTFDIVAEDAHGELVSDLRPEDFRVADAGRRQPLAYFRRGRDIADGSNSLTRARSNAAYPTFPRSVVLVIDQLNARIELTGEEWDEMARAFRRVETDNDLFLYVLRKNGALYPIRELPDSWVETAPSRPPLSEILPLFDTFRRSNEPRPEELDASRTRAKSPDWVQIQKRMQLLTESAFLELTARLRTVPGPASIVWIGSFDIRDKWSAPVSKGNVAIQDSNGAPIRAVPVYYVAPQMSTLAKGRPDAPLRNADVAAAIRRAVSDSERGYRVGYFPSDSNWDGRRHDVRITCARPGVVIRGAYAYNAVRPIDIQDDRRQATPDLLSISPFDSSTIRFSVESVSATRYSVRVNADDLLCPEGECSLATQAIHYLRNGEYQVRRDAVFSDGKLAPIEFDLPAVQNADRARIVVLDRRTQSFGTLTIPLARSNP